MEEDELLGLMKDPRYSASDAAKIVGIAPGRLQTWMNRGFFSFKSIEQGPRRILRRFDGHDLIMLGTMVELVDNYGLDVSDAQHIASCTQTDVTCFLMAISSPKEDLEQWKTIRHYYTLDADGEVNACFSVDTVHEARERIGKYIFTVFDAGPAVYKAIQRVLDLIVKEDDAALAHEAKQAATS